MHRPRMPHTYHVPVIRASGSYIQGLEHLDSRPGTIHADDVGRGGKRRPTTGRPDERSVDGDLGVVIVGVEGRSLREKQHVFLSGIPAHCDGSQARHERQRGEEETLGAHSSSGASPTIC